MICAPWKLFNCILKVRQKYILNHCLKKGPILGTGYLLPIGAFLAISSPLRNTTYTYM